MFKRVLQMNDLFHNFVIYIFKGSPFHKPYRLLRAPLPHHVEILYIPNSIKVALDIGNCALGSYCLAGHSNKALHCVRMPKCSKPKCPKQPYLCTSLL